MTIKEINWEYYATYRGNPVYRTLSKPSRDRVALYDYMILLEEPITDSQKQIITSSPRTLEKVINKLYGNKGKFNKKFER